MNLKIYQNVTIFDAVLDMIGAIDYSDFSVEHIVIVPDRFSLICEKLLLEKLSSKALFNVRVVSLTKFSNQLLFEMGVKIGREDLLTSGEILLLTQKAIENVKGEFKTFKKNRISFCYEVSKLIAQFKSSGVTPEKLNINAGGLAGLKYHDLKLIYEQYQRLLGDKLDANERLNLLSEKLTGDVLKNAKVYFAGFDAFTSETYALVKKLILSAKEVSLALAKPVSEGNEYIYEKDIQEKVVSLCGEIGISAQVVSKSPVMDDCKEALVKGLYSYEKIKQNNNGFYNLFSCQNIYEEVEAVAKLIRYAVYKGERYKNISIAVGGLEKYMVQIENIFDRYDIPYYIDSAITADKSLYGKLIFAFFEVALYGYSQDRLVNLFSNILLGDNSEIIEKCQLLAIDNKQKYKEYIEKDFAFYKELEDLNSCKTAQDYQKVILEILDKVSENFDNLMDVLEEKSILKEKNINIQVYEIIKDQLALISRYNAQEISLQEYQKTLMLLLSFFEVSTVPTFVDGVMIGDATESMFSQSKILIVMGGENLPVVSTDNGLLSDEDLLCNHASPIEPTIKMINRRNRFKLFSLLNLAEKNLIITFQITNEEGKKNELPSYITSLNGIFQQLPIRAGSVFFADEDEDLEIALLSSKQSYRDFKQIDKEFLPAEKAKKLMFENDRARVTQIENYFACPFKHFLAYGLKIKEIEKPEVDGRDVGNICHAGAEEFIKLLMKNQFKFNIDIAGFINENFDKFLGQSLKDRLNHLSEKESFIKLVKRQLLSILKSIVRELRATIFRPKFLEKDFESKFDGSGITLVGRADRIDFAEGYFRIIDYKTGKTGTILKELYYGEKLQLFLYQKEAKESFGLACAGGYYFNSAFDYSKDDEDVTILKGLAPDDEEVILKLDNSLEFYEKSNILSIARDSKGGFKGSGISKYDLTKLCNYAFAVAKKAVDEICEGYITAKPCQSACEWCKYHPICGYEQGKRKSNANFDF